MMYRLSNAMGKYPSYVCPLKDTRYAGCYQIDFAGEVLKSSLRFSSIAFFPRVR